MVEVWLLTKDSEGDNCGVSHAELILRIMYSCKLSFTGIPLSNPCTLTGIPNPR